MTFGASTTVMSALPNTLDAAMHAASSPAPLVRAASDAPSGRDAMTNRSVCA